MFKFNAGKGKINFWRVHLGCWTTCIWNEVAVYYSKLNTHYKCYFCTLQSLTLYASIVNTFAEMEKEAMSLPTGAGFLVRYCERLIFHWILITLFHELLYHIPLLKQALQRTGIVCVHYMPIVNTPRVQRLWHLTSEWKAMGSTSFSECGFVCLPCSC